MGQKFPRGYLKKLVLSEAGPPDECWLWPGRVSEVGYGTVHVDGKNQYVHRVAYAHRHGMIPNGLVIDHSCRQPTCFNPSHLEAVTQAVNIQRAARGPGKPLRYPRGYLPALVVSEAGPPGDCWIWPGHINLGGYGTVGLNGRTVKAHRASYEAHYGKIADGLEIDHSCHQRACFNHRHLRAVSRVENMRNKRIQKNNVSGCPGVHWNVAMQRWVARVNVDGERQYLGLYRTKKEAIKIAKEARRQLGYIN